LKRDTPWDTDREFLIGIYGNIDVIMLIFTINDSMMGILMGDTDHQRWGYNQQSIDGI
jgi:hypothetical protein